MPCRYRGDAGCATFTVGRGLHRAPFTDASPRSYRAGMSENGAAISIRNLVKEYAGSGNAPPKLALKGVSFDVPEGGIFGLLGPNGAGKSTLINIMAGLVMKTSGEIEIWGHDIDRDHRNAKLMIGIVPQEIVFDPFFTPFEVLAPRTLEVTYDRDASSAGQVLALVQQHGYAIEDVTTREADLEDVFVSLTTQAN